MNGKLKKIVWPEWHVWCVTCDSFALVGQSEECYTVREAEKRLRHGPLEEGKPGWKKREGVWLCKECAAKLLPDERQTATLECPGCGFDYLTSYDPGCCDVCRGKGPATNPDEK